MPPISRSADARHSLPASIAEVRLYPRLSYPIITAIILTIMFSLPAMAAAPRAVWVWEEDAYQLLDSEDSWNETFAFLASRKLTTLYLYADEFRGRDIIESNPEKYRRLIAALHKRGCKVYALLGSAYLNTQEYILPRQRVAATRMFENVLRYNAASAAVERFDGVNIDIEPYLLDDWKEKRILRATQYLDLAAEFMQLKRKAGDTLAVGPAMPFWFDGIEDIEWNGKRQRLSDHVQDIYDYVAIMDYRNVAQGSDGIIAHATDELAYANRKAKTVVIGVETLQTEPRKVTFYGMGRAAMEEQLRIAEAEFSSHPSFSGFAIHHFRSYRKMTDSVPK